MAICLPVRQTETIQPKNKAGLQKVIHTIADRSDDDDDEILKISTIEVDAMEDTRHSIHDTRDETFATLEITQPDKKRKIYLQCKVDKGAQNTVLPIRLLRMIVPRSFDDEGIPKTRNTGKERSHPFSIWRLYNKVVRHHKYSL